MKLTLALVTALLLASPATQAQQADPDTVRDRLWHILGLAGIDQGIPSAPWMRDWIKKHGDEKLSSSPYLPFALTDTPIISHMKPLLLFFLASGLGGFCGGAEPPQVFRNFMPDTGPSAFGVVLGPELTLIYDPLRGGVNQVWRGTLDLAPTRRAKINEPAAVVGAVFYQEVMVQPLRVGSADAVPMRRFKGYRYEQDAVVFDYTLDGVLIRETMRAAADGGVERMLSAAPGTVIFYLAEAQSASRLTITCADEVRPGVWRHEAVEGRPLTLNIQPLAAR